MNKDEDDVDLEDIYKDKRVLCFLRDHAGSEAEKKEIHWRIREYERNKGI